MNEILFNDRFQRIWLSGVAKTLKPLNSDITIFFMKQYLFKNAEYSVQNNISTFYQVAY